MKLYPRVLVACAVSAALAFASPQPLPDPETPTAVPVPRFAFTQTIEWPPTAPAPGEITQTIAGDFDGDERRDVVALDGAQPLFLYAPTNWSVVHRIAAQANAIETAQGAGPQGRDSIACVGDLGLRRLDFSPALHTFTPVSVSATPAWIGATRVRCEDANANGTLDFAGVCADSTHVVTLLDPGPNAIEVVFDAGTSVRDIRFVAWNGTASRELAVLTTRGLQIRTPGGTLIQSFPVLDGSRDLMLRVVLADSPGENLGWLRSSATDPDGLEFVLVNSRGVRPQFALPPEIEDVYALVGADASYGGPLDGDTDLLFCTAHDPLPWFAQNLSDESATPLGGPYFDATTIAPLSLSSSEPLAAATGALESRAQPVWEDLDGDKRIDYLAWTGFASEFRFYSGVSTTIQMLLGDQFLRAASFRHDPVLGTDELLLKLSYAPMALYLCPDGNTEFEIRVWRQPAIWSDLEAVATYSLRVPLAEDPSVKSELNGYGVPSPFVVARIGLKHEEEHSGDEACFTSIYWFEFRTITRETANVPHPWVKVSPMYAAYLAANPADVVTLWQPCFSLLLPLEGLTQCSFFPPYWFYSTPTCSSGSQEPAHGPILGTRRRVIPISETLPVVPAPAPLDPDPRYCAWWLEPI